MQTYQIIKRILNSGWILMLTFAKLLNGNMLTGQDQPLDHLFGWYKNGSVTHNRPAPTWVVVFLAILSNEILCPSLISVCAVSPTQALSLRKMVQNLHSLMQSQGHGKISP